MSKELKGLLDFMHKESVKAGSAKNQASIGCSEDIILKGERKSISEELSAFRPQHETLSEKKDRWFGVWEPEQPNPAKFISESKSSKDLHPSFPKFPEGSSDPAVHSNAAVHEIRSEAWLSTVMRIAFGIEF